MINIFNWQVYYFVGKPRKNVVYWYKSYIWRLCGNRKKQAQVWTNLEANSWRLMVSILHWGVIFQIHHMIEKIWWWGMIANRLKSPNDIWRLKIKKWADMEATYMTLCCHILCKNGVLFCIIQHLLFGFCSSQCSIYVVKFSKTHTMVVHFSGCSGEKENWEHHHPGALKLVARGYQRKLDFSPCLSFLMLHVVFDQHINSPHHQLSQSDWQGFP